jgi:hypothetical protein
LKFDENEENVRMHAADGFFQFYDQPFDSAGSFPIIRDFQAERNDDLPGAEVNNENPFTCITPGICPASCVIESTMPWSAASPMSRLFVSRPSSDGDGVSGFSGQLRPLTTMRWSDRIHSRGPQQCP